jgi:hypothetical protein
MTINRISRCVVAGFFLTVSGWAMGQGSQVALPPNYIHVDAPMAQRLTIATKLHHPEIVKLGIHATPPSSEANAIIGSDAPVKVGKKSSDKDMVKLTAGKPTAERIDKDSIYDLFLPLTDAKGRDIGQGFVVMEVPLTKANSPEDALKIGVAIRNELQRQIPDKAALYKQ